MNELQQILKELQDLKDRVSYLENLTNTSIKLKGGDPWAGIYHTDGPHSHWPKTEPKFEIPTEVKILGEKIRVEE